MSLDTLALVRWLATDGRALRDAPRLLQAVCTQLLSSRVPLARALWAVQSSRPDELGVGLSWRPEQPVERREYRFMEIAEDRFARSPLRTVFNREGPIRRRLLEPDCRMDFPVLAELRAEGITDYLALPMPMGNGLVHAAVWSSDADFGFEAEHTERLEAVTEMVALLLDR